MGRKQKQALIFGSMPLRDVSVLEEILAAEPLIICADGGLGVALSLGLRPDYIIGDNDSGGRSMPDIPFTLLPAEKDLTDAQAAVDLAISKACGIITLAGCTGGRGDHNLASLFLLEYIDAKGGRGRLIDEQNEYLLLNRESYSAPVAFKYRYFSLIPLDETVLVSVSEAKYPLSDKLLKRGDTLGISNEALTADVKIVCGGKVFLIMSERK